MPNRPVISVVMPVYNVERYVRQAIESVLDQTFRPFELIVVDDGGDDGSMAIVEGYDDPRIRILRQPNRGLAGARNTGIDAAAGEFVALLDSDDWWHPEKLMLHVAHLRASHADVSCCGSVLVDEAGRPIGVRQPGWPGKARPQDVFCGRVVRNGSVPVIRRAMLQAAALPPTASGRVQYFDETLRRSEDIECWTRLAVCNGAQFGAVQRDLTYYRITRSGLSADIIRQLESWDVVCAKIGTYAPEFIAEFGAEARALELRYLARRSFHQQDRGLALGLALEAIGTWPRLLTADPRKTFATLAACLLLRTLPTPVFTRLLGMAAPGFAA